MEPMQQVIARGQCDATDCLLSADEPLASLQRACGGDLPGLVAVPDLLALVRGVRVQGRPFARMVRAQDERHSVSAWIEAVPDDGGCLLAVSGWQTVALPLGEQGTALDDRSLRALAAGAYLRLDENQNVLAFSVSDPLLQQLRASLSAASNRPWTDFVVVDGYSEPQSLHWRLLDQAIVEPLGCEGRWRALLAPQFGTDRALIGFDLHLLAVPEDPASDRGDGLVDLPFERDVTSVLGKALTSAVVRPVERIAACAEAMAGQLAGPLPDHYAIYASDIREAAGHLHGLIDDLAACQALERGDPALSVEPVDMIETARTAAAMLRRKAEECGTTVVVSRAQAPVVACGDRRRVLQILLNLLDNALRYAPAGGTVRIEGGVLDGRARLTVTDAGSGVPDEDRERLFEPFERLGRDDSGGSGLGLSIARRLARAMDGDLSADGCSEEGSSFTLELPVAEA